MIAATLRRRSEVEAILVQELPCINNKAALATAMAAEHLRALIYGASAANDDFSKGTIHTNRLLAAVRRSVDSLYPSRPLTKTSQSEKFDRSADALQRLGEIGDASDSGGGQWIAAPIRIVIPENSQRFLLVGAAPGPVVHRRLGLMPICSGVSRFFSAQGQVNIAIESISQSVDTWLGNMIPLKSWTDRLLAEYESRLQETQDISAEQLEVYAPDICRLQRRSGRWVPAAELGSTSKEIRLCRPRGAHARSFDRPYYLAYFALRRGLLTIRRSVPIDQRLTLRLRFGLDARLRTPRRISLSYSGATISLEKPLLLPEPERRVYALAWKDSDESETSEKIIFHRDAMPIVRQALRRLELSPSFLE